MKRMLEKLIRWYDGSWWGRWLDTWSVYPSHTFVVLVLMIIILLLRKGVL